MSCKFRQFYGAMDWTWIHERIPILRVEDTCGIVAEINGKISAAVIFDNFLYGSVQMQAVIDNPFVLKYGLHTRALRFAFYNAKKERIYGYIRSDNIRSIRLGKKLAFKKVFIIPNGYDKGVDYWLMELTKERAEKRLNLVRGI